MGRGEAARDAAGGLGRSQGQRQFARSAIRRCRAEFVYRPNGLTRTDRSRYGKEPYARADRVRALSSCLRGAQPTARARERDGDSPLGRDDRPAEDGAARIPHRIWTREREPVGRDRDALDRGAAVGGPDRCSGGPAARRVDMLDRDAVGAAPVAEVPVRADDINGGEGDVERRRAGGGRCLDGYLVAGAAGRGGGDQKGGNNDQTAAHARRIFSCSGLPETATVSAIALKVPWTIMPG